MRTVTSFFFLASVFCVTFEKVHWSIAGTVSLADVLALLFLAAFAVTTVRLRAPRTAAVLAGFFAAFLVVYLLGYFDLSDSDALGQWGKGWWCWLPMVSVPTGAWPWMSTFSTLSSLRYCAPGVAVRRACHCSATVGGRLGLGGGGFGAGRFAGGEQDGAKSKQRKYGWWFHQEALAGVAWFAGSSRSGRSSAWPGSRPTRSAP